MSDMTSLSSNYSETATFAKDFNGAVLVLKKQHLARAAIPAPKADAEAQARVRLAAFLQGIYQFLGTVGLRSPRRAPTSARHRPRTERARSCQERSA